MPRSAGRPIASLVAAFLLVSVVTAAQAAAAEPLGTIVVTGKVATRDRAALESGIVTALRKASWSMSVQPFSPAEIDTITRCLAGDDKPWRCLSAVLGPRGIDRIVIAETSAPPDAPSKLSITGELVVADAGAAAIVQRRCDACDEARLMALAQQITEELLTNMAMRGETTLALTTVPAGSRVLLDGQFIGNTDTRGTLTYNTIPGPHIVAVHHAGFVDSEHPIDLPVARTTPLAIELQAAKQPGHPLLLPLAVGGAGAAALALGIGLQLSEGPPPVGTEQPNRLVSVPGVILIAGGSAAIGLGVYLFVRSMHNTPASMPTAMVTADGAIVGWHGDF